MKWKNMLYYLVCLLMMFHFVYQGVYKWLDWSYFKLWLNAMPHLKHVANALFYLIPIIQLIIGALFLFPVKHLLAFYTTLFFELAETGYFIWALLYGVVFVKPYHSYWKTSPWPREIYFGIGLSIVCLFVILLMEKKWLIGNESKELRNQPARNC